MGNEYLDKANDYLGNVLFLSFIKVNLKFFVPIFIFVEDVWPYQFHNGVEYTPFMEKCMEEM